MSIASRIQQITSALPRQVTLVAVSKTHPPADILEAYNAGQRVFGENKVQELMSKYAALPKDIQWHLIGHLQTNKVKYIAPFVTMIHSVDSRKLLEEISKQAIKQQRIIDCLLQVHIASEESKFGFELEACLDLFDSGGINNLQGIRIRGLMGMATNTDDQKKIRAEFSQLRKFYDQLHEKGFAFDILSMGMSADYPIAVEEGSTMVRIGSTIFGERN